MLRATGQKYINTNGDTVAAKAPKPVDCTKCKLKCYQNITEEQRIALCQDYYVLGDYWKQRNYICTSVDTFEPDSRLSNKGVRAYSAKYYLMVDGQRINVCQKFFLSTLNVSQKLVRLALEKKTETGQFGHSDQRGKKTQCDPGKDDQKDRVRQHIASYPAVESHYLRKKTTKNSLTLVSISS